MRRALLPAALVLGLTVSLAQPATAAPAETSPDRFEDLRLDSPITDARMDPELRGQGTRTVNVVLASDAVGEVSARGGSKAAQQARGRQIAAEQAAVMAEVRAADPAAEQVAAADTAINSIVVEADVAALRELAGDPRIASVSIVKDYEMDLSETVPYIGATAVQETGVDGTGVTVAVLDSGVDFTHAAFGGPGTVDFYTQCYGTGPTASGQPFDAAPAGECADYFGPGAKVVGGVDFVGEAWPNGARYTDPNPIDFEGHGTHVADIIAGEQGVAPGASIEAVKVCSAVSSSCNGVALILAMDYVLDPDGDGDTSDKVDIVNMSLGSNYGQAFDDDLAFAVEVASANGVLTVASAGNSSDKPFITGTPAAAPSALSVAQTEVPSAGLQLIDVGGQQFPAVYQPWSAPLTDVVSGTLQRGNGAGGNLLGCDPFPAGSLTGLVVLVDRGACNFTLKAANVANAGGVATIIGLVTPELPFTGANGGDAGADQAPAFMIGLPENLAMRQLVGQTATIDPADVSPVVGTVTGSSSRGPSMSGQVLKPEIGAPGASVSAIAGSGDGTEAFGGTSGAAPMVAGSAALLVQAHPGRIPAEYKAVLMNTAETDILNLPAVIGGELAPISRIGGGEVRADRAVASDFAAWNGDATSGGLSFGLVEVTEPTAVSQTVVVRNYSDSETTFTVTPEFRFTDDAASGGVTPSAPATVTVPADGTAELEVTLALDPAGLPDWTLNSGAAGASGDTLTAMEFDGYLNLSSDAGDLHLPWHVIPRKAADVSLVTGPRPAVGNEGRTDATIELYTLLGTSPDQPEGGLGEQNPTPDLRASGYAAIPVPAGFCSANPSALLTFASNTWERQTHANAPASLSFFVDTDRDGTDDYEVFSFDLALTLADGRNLAYVADLRTGALSAFFFTDHDTMSGNTVLTVCAEQLGLNGADPAVEIDVTPAVFDLYFTGAYTDQIPTATITPFDGRDTATLGGQELGVVLPAGETARLQQRSDSGTGTLLLVRGGAPDGQEAFVLPARGKGRP
jgi:subtilisin family serine protease